jgi:tetratricopeptide (TPR) repeat protein
LLRQAVAAIEEAIAIRRDLGLHADLAMSLNNASNRYSDLAGLEETQEGRVRLLEQAVTAIGEAVCLNRELGLQADLAMSLNNASLRYGDLAGQEEAREGRVRQLEQAVTAIEEAVAIRRDLGLRADLAMSLNNAAKAYFGMMGVDEDEELQVEWLRKALQAIQEAVDIFRVQGIIPYLMVGLRNVVIFHLQLAERTGELDRARVLALCREGEALCGPMEDQERLDFFRQVRQQLQS